MTLHVRQQQLNAIKTRLTGLTTTGTRVFLSRVAPIQRDEVPCLIIQAGPEQIRTETIGVPRIRSRAFQVDIVCAVRAADGLDAALNVIFAEVEAALGMPVSLAGVKTITLDNIDRPKLEQGEQPVAQAAMAYLVESMTVENAPTTAV